MFGINYRLEKGLECLVAEVDQNEVRLFPNYRIQEDQIFDHDALLSDALMRMSGQKVKDPIAVDLIERKPGQVVLRKGSVYYCIEARNIDVLGGCPC